MKRKYLLAVFCLIVFAFAVTGCEKRHKEEPTEETTEESIIPENVLTNLVITGIDREFGRLTFMNYSENREQTLVYNSGTAYFDSYGTTIGVDSLTPGDVVNVKCSARSIEIKEVSLSKDVWTYEIKGPLKVDSKIMGIALGDRNYRYSENVQIFSGSEKKTFEELSDKDEFLITGIGKDIYSIKVTNGHGYVKLINDDSYVGGWIEIGKTIKPIEKGMVIEIPEGMHKVNVIANGIGGSGEITVARGEETELDLSAYAERLNKYGKLSFKIDPKDATLKINGETKDATKEYELDCGIYIIEVSKKDYETYVARVFVKEDKAVMQITLNKLEEGSSQSKSSSGSSKSSSQSSTQSSTQSSSSQSSTQSSSSSEEKKSETEKKSVEKHLD